MRPLTFVTFALLAACFSKPGYHGRDAATEGGGDDATDAVDAPPRSISVPDSKLAAGSNHACAIDAASNLWCWGDNLEGQLGPSAPLRNGTPIDPQPTLTGAWTAVAAGSRHTCGIHAGQIVCWGRNDQNQSGGNNPANTVELPGAVAPSKLFAGDEASCATDGMGKLYCWGKIDQTATALATPTQILPGQLAEPWAVIAPGNHHTCAIFNRDLPAHCWGENTHKQLARPGGSVALTNSAAIGGHAFIDISVNEFSTCGITVDNELQCYGRPGSGHLGPYMGPSTETAVEVGDGFVWTDIALGFDHACGIANGKVRCYGVNTAGAMGNGFGSHLTPDLVSLPSGLDAAAIVSGREFSCARDVTGTVFCWGVNRSGELGNGEVASTRTPVLVPLLTVNDTVLQIAVGDGHSCALVARPGNLKEVMCWGDNRSRQVDNLATFAELPRSSVFDLVEISAGGVHTCGIRSDRTQIHCWGNNQSAQLGRSNLVNGTHDVPRPAIGQEWRTVAAGSTASCGITVTDDLHCWGSTPSIGMPLSAAPPMQISDPSHAWSGIVLGSGFAAGIVDTGEVAAFGRGCPYGSATDAEAFTAAQIANHPGEQFQLATAQGQGEHMCIHVAGSPPTISCWGSNARRQINTDVDPAACYNRSPASLVGAEWINPALGSLSIAGGHSCAIADITPGATIDPRLYCWGADDTRMLGISTNTGAPFKVNDLIVSEVATGRSHTCVIAKANAAAQEEVHCWGENRYGEVGNGARFRDTPVAVALP